MIDTFVTPINDTTSKHFANYEYQRIVIRPRETNSHLSARREVYLSRIESSGSGLGRKPSDFSFAIRKARRWTKFWSARSLATRNIAYDGERSGIERSRTAVSASLHVRTSRAEAGRGIVARVHRTENAGDKKRSTGMGVKELEMNSICAIERERAPGRRNRARRTRKGDGEDRIKRAGTTSVARNTASGGLPCPVVDRRQRAAEDTMGAP